MKPPAKTNVFWKSTRNKVIVISGFVTASAALITNINSIGGFFSGLFSKSSGVRIVDLTIGTNDTMDIKLRNSGTTIAYIKKMEVTVKKRWKLLTDGNLHLYQQPPTAIYDLHLDSNFTVPAVFTKSLSQTIKPNETDRFLVSLYADLSTQWSAVYLADITLFFDEDNKSLIQKNVLFGFSLPLQHYSLHRAQNLEMLTEIKAIKGERSVTLEELLKKVEE